MDAEQLAGIIKGFRYSYSGEKELQDGIAAALDSSGVEYSREFPLSAADRLDFMVGMIAVEVKIKGTRADALRQIHRYAQHDAVGGIVVVTTKARHLDMPTSLNGKPVCVASLLEGAF